MEISSPPEEPQPSTELAFENLQPPKSKDSHLNLVKTLQAKPPSVDFSH